MKGVECGGSERGRKDVKDFVEHLSLSRTNNYEGEVSRDSITNNALTSFASKAETRWK